MASSWQKRVVHAAVERDRPAPSSSDVASSGTVFGVAIRPQGDAPPLLSKLVRYLHGKAPETRDIFAVDDVNEREINALKRRVSVADREPVQLSSYTKNPHVVAVLLKTFLGELPQPLLTAALYDAFISATYLERHEDTVVLVRHLVSLLPKGYKATTKQVVGLLKAISQVHEVTNMPSSKLAVVFSGYFLRPMRSMQYMRSDRSRCAAIVEILIDDFEFLFNSTSRILSRPSSNITVPNVRMAPRPRLPSIRYGMERAGTEEELAVFGRPPILMQRLRSKLAPVEDELEEEESNSDFPGRYLPAADALVHEEAAEDGAAPAEEGAIPTGEDDPMEAKASGGSHVKEPQHGAAAESNGSAREYEEQTVSEATESVDVADDTGQGSGEPHGGGGVDDPIESLSTDVAPQDDTQEGDAEANGAKDEECTTRENADDSEGDSTAEGEKAREKMTRTVHECEEAVHVVLQEAADARDSFGQEGADAKALRSKLLLTSKRLTGLKMKLQGFLATWMPEDAVEGYLKRHECALSMPKHEPAGELPVRVSLLWKPIETCAANIIHILSSILSELEGGRVFTDEKVAVFVKAIEL